MGTTGKKLPKAYRDLKERYGEYLGAVEKLGSTVKQAGPIGEKTAQLVQLTAAPAIRSAGAGHRHARGGPGAGATPEEIRHALILLTSTIGFPTVVAGLTWVGDILEGKRGKE